MQRLLGQSSPLPVFPMSGASLLLEDFHPCLSLDLFYLTGCLFFSSFHHVLFVAVSVSDCSG